MTSNPGTRDHRHVAAILEREWKSVTDLLGTMRAGGWAHPTRCTGWTVMDLARHVVWGVSMEADALRRAAAGVSEPAEGRTMSVDSAPAEVLAALKQAAKELVGEVRSLVPDDDARTCPMPYGPVPLVLALDVFVFEAGIHASDFADAVGLDRPLAADVVPATTAVLEGFLPVFAGAGTNQPPDGTTFSLRSENVTLEGRWSGSGLVMGLTGPQASLTVDGDDSSVLLFATGRLGAHDPRLRISGARELAQDFKMHVPGP